MRNLAIEQQRHRWFLEDIAASRERVLLVDYDGTLAPLFADRGCAFPYPGICDLLKRIMKDCETRVIATSERPAHEIRRLLGLQPAPEVWGSDGLERIYTDGRYECADLDVPVDSLRTLAECESTLEREGLKSFIEVRLAGVTVYLKGMSDAESLNARIRAHRVFQPLAAAHPGLRLMEFEGRVELRLRAANKGDAVRRLLASLPPDAAVAYLGDDTVDEDAFRVLNGRGLTVLVRSLPRFTAAQICLRPPEELVYFLKDWIGACTGAL